MRITHTTILTLAIIGATLRTASLAVEEQVPKGPLQVKTVPLKLIMYKPKVFLLKTRGEEMVGLRFREGTMEVEFEGTGVASRMSYDPQRESMTASNGFILRVLSGTNAVTVTADELVTELDRNVKPRIAMPAKLVHLKAGGEFIAQLQIPLGKTFEIEGKQGHYYSNGQTTMKGNAVLRISSSGRSPVVVEAEEIQADPDYKPFND
jgi:hypothetical protein